MNRTWNTALVVTGLVYTLGGTSSWATMPDINDFSDTNGNTAVGTGSLQKNTTGQTNTASGSHALFSNTTGSYNTASGAIALYSNNRWPRSIPS